MGEPSCFRLLSWTVADLGGKGVQEGISTGTRRESSTEIGRTAQPDGYIHSDSRGLIVIFLDQSADVVPRIRQATARAVYLLGTP